MRLFLGITDYDWFSLHASKHLVEEVNFWRPSAETNFRALAPGEPFLFKLHAPRNYIVGGGFFAKFLRLPVSLAWDSFGEANGARSLAEVKSRISKYRNVAIGPHEDPNIGCIILVEPFFFPEPDWIPVPAAFKLNIVQGRGYGLDEEDGQYIWRAVGERLAQIQVNRPTSSPAILAATDAARYGRPMIVTPRLGQGAFRVMVTDIYQRRCAMTGERTLPVLEAAHIKPYAEGGVHELRNGLLLRSDLHKLFDAGYLTVDPDERRILVSRRIREEFDNGRDYYALEGRVLRDPMEVVTGPAREYLAYHADNVFRE
ncbi:HNH endonuclease [Paludibaculum fermentans]|uniref:HNH endonuclease n=1 Tax=Paludibaculum fermentans TaxID=1473598 RepID=UPI003EC0603E